MIYPSIDKMLNIVDSKYRLVHIVAKRSKQMFENNHYQLKEYESQRNIGRVLEELLEGMIKLK